MKENLEKEKKDLLDQIEIERNKLFSLEEENLSKSFGKFFVKPLLLAMVFALILKYMGLDDRNIIGGFLIGFIVLLFVFSLKTKRDFEKRSKIIQEEKIKIQSQIFALARKLKEIDDDIEKENEDQS